MNLSMASQRSSMASMSPAAIAVVVGDAVDVEEFVLLLVMEMALVNVVVIVMVHDIRLLLSGYYAPFPAHPQAPWGVLKEK